MTFVALFLEVIAALAKFLGLRSAEIARANERELGASLALAEAMKDEEKHILAASRAGLDISGLPIETDPQNRDNLP